MRRATTTTLAALALIWTVALPATAGQPVPGLFDTFKQQTYAGNDGSKEFSGPWIEIGENDGPNSGFVWVWNHEYCSGGYCFKMGGSDVGAEGPGASRALDLSSAISAELRFDMGRQLLDDGSEGAAVVQISPDGSDTWSILESISLDTEDGEVSFHRNYPITEFATENTVIRFKITEAEKLDTYWIIDNVLVEATFEKPPSSTTSTTRTPTTKTPATTTTTTKPHEATTTTTSTKPRETTTTTEPRETTTTSTEPPVTTTTTLETTSTTSPRFATSTESHVAVGDGLSADDHEAMMGKAALAVPAALGTTAMPASATGDSTPDGHHIEPIEAFAVAFLTESGDYGGNLIPSVVLGIVIAVVGIVGISSRKED
jgi:hypothetical protein